MPKSVTFDRNQVIQNVMELFWRNGYNGTSMQDLVDVTGLNRSSFYNSFGDKFTLFEESLRHYQHQQDEWLKNHINHAKTPKEAIISLFEGMSKDISSGNQKGCMITGCTSEMSHDPQVRDFLAANKERVVTLFKELIEEAQKNGEIDPEKDADTLALYLFSNLQGIRLTSMIDTNLDGVINQVLTSL